jgi:hypothetical protein
METREMSRCGSTGLNVPCVVWWGPVDASISANDVPNTRLSSVPAKVSERYGA